MTVRLLGPNGSSGVNLVNPNNIEKVVDASDLAFDSFVKSRIGSAGVLGFRNKIVDGRFDFWYEGTSQTSSGYGSDTMWKNAHSGSTKVHSQQSLVAGVDSPSIDCPSAKYFSRTTVTSVAGINNYVAKLHIIEDVRTLAGKSVTLSFYSAEASSKPIGVCIQQNFGSGGSATNYIAGQLVSNTPSLSRKSLQFNIPSISGKTIGTDSTLTIMFFFDCGSTIATLFNMAGLGQQSGTFDLACIQLEEGSIATPFEELPIEISQQRLNRYFRTSYPYGTVIGSTTSWSHLWYKCTTGDNYNYVGWVDFGTKMRTTPTATSYGYAGTPGYVTDTIRSLNIPAISSPTDQGIMFYVNNTTLTYPVEFHWHYKADARL